ncbi:uncharacterized protein TM35_000162340 [Trypanosoma theileri]|uniref:PA domain-containing protein n=1 Tax=Trypanosoma theileri TaxID=67003 RepID=A0A1X0NV69_9TRYP|nr:uncharacterized protein TM35_000162340 [Trypanosoma theileri]ORC88596.1 hypothetical protein TM35_000162340 [Trypanosoma theileri]
MRQIFSPAYFILFFFLVNISLDVNALVVHRPAALARLEFSPSTVNFGPPVWSGREYRGVLLIVQDNVVCRSADNSSDVKEKNEESWHGRVLMVMGGRCSQAAAAMNAESRGAVGVLLESGTETGKNAPLVNIPVEILSEGDHRLLEDFVNKGFTVEVSLGHNLNVLRYAV